MSTAAVPMLDVDSAYAVVQQKVYAPTFFEKLASVYGIVPRNDVDRMELLTMAHQLHGAHEAQQEKVAAAEGSLLTKARMHLQGVLGDQGAAPDPMDSFTKQAALRDAADPEIAHAILSMQAAAAGYAPAA